MENSLHAQFATRPLFLVDDDEFDRVLFARLLGQSRVPNPCRVFAHGEELIDGLIAVLRGAPMPLVCFVDVRMPGMNGFDVLRWIRCQRALDAMPVVMLSASEEPAHLQEAGCFGAQCYLAKFPDATQLLEIVCAATQAADASASHPFKLPCNLLVGSPHAMS